MPLLSSWKKATAICRFSVDLITDRLNEQTRDMGGLRREDRLQRVAPPGPGVFRYLAYRRTLLQGALLSNHLPGVSPVGAALFAADATACRAGPHAGHGRAMDVGRHGIPGRPAVRAPLAGMVGASLHLLARQLAAGPGRVGMQGSVGAHIRASTGNRRKVRILASFYYVQSTIMKKTLLTVVASGVLAALAGTAAADTGNISFIGEITNAACAIGGGQDGAAMTVAMGSVPATMFAAIGDRGPQTEF